MPKHTPGAWKVGEYEDGNVTPHVKMIMVVAPKSKNFVQEICCFPVKGKGRANALLIAAAPDLLDMLKAAVARVELANSEGDPILSAWLPEARAAISKAQGGE
jgi:hypothetical protein